jgi:hypothetical protein
MPAAIDLRSRPKKDKKDFVEATLAGPNLALLVPTASHAITLVVRGGTPVAAVESDVDLFGRIPRKLRIRFPRALLVASIRAALDAGTIPPGADLVPVSLIADGFAIGEVHVRLVGAP